MRRRSMGHPYRSFEKNNQSQNSLKIAEMHFERSKTPMSLIGPEVH